MLQADDDNDEDLFAAISSAHSTAATIHFGASALGQGLAPGLGQVLVPGSEMESPLSPLSRKMSRGSHPSNTGPAGLPTDATPLLSTDGTRNVFLHFLRTLTHPIIHILRIR